MAIRIFVIAAVFPMVGANVTLTGLCPIEAMPGSMHSQTWFLALAGVPGL